MTTVDRFWAKVDKRGPMLSLQLGPCWLWTGAQSDGYGHLKIRGRTWRAHRWLWEQWHGPVRNGLELDHLCRNRACVNPAHLEEVTRRENIMRGACPAVQRRRHAAVTHCPHGHAYSVGNTSRRPNGARRCLRCHREAQRARRERQRQ